MKEIFPQCLFPLIEEYTLKSEKPIILDVGSGPLSMLSYVKENDLADLKAVDPLAEEYKLLLEKYNYNIKYPLIECPGEKLTEKFEENSVDITWIHNALDHSQNPEEVLTSSSIDLIIMFFPIAFMRIFFYKDSYVKTRNKILETTTPNTTPIRSPSMKFR